MKKSWPSVECSLEALSFDRHQQAWDYLALASNLQSMGKQLVSASAGHRNELIAAFHNCAGKLPYPDDCDIGALILESAGDETPDAEHRKWLYQEAYFRATWCASSGSAGGETLARLKHLKRVDEKLHKEQ